MLVNEELEVQSQDHIELYQLYKKYLTKSNNNQDIIAYVAGFFDGDGCISSSKNNILAISITQAKKGYSTLEFIKKHFGGCIYKHSDATEKTQEQFSWKINGGENINKFIKKILPYTLLKKRELELGLEFPYKVITNLEIIAINKITKNELRFDSLINCAKELKIDYKLISNLLIKNPILEKNNWIITKIIKTDNEIKVIDEKRKNIIEQLKILKKTPHDNIHHDYTPSKAYLAGFVDAEGCLGVCGRSCHSHIIGQKYKPILEVFQRLYGGGKIVHRKSGLYAWKICKGGKDFLEDIYPYLICKKTQATIILNMKKDAPAIHQKINKMKGIFYKEILPIPDNYYLETSTLLHKRKLKIKDKTSKYIGVKLDRTSWNATIKKDKVVYNLGNFKHEIDAAKAYNIKALELYGKDAQLNIIEDIELKPIIVKKTRAKSQYRGVHLSGKKWQAYFRHNKIRYNLGIYENIIDAVQAYNNKAIEVLGNNAIINNI